MRQEGLARLMEQLLAARQDWGDGHLARRALSRLPPQCAPEPSADTASVAVSFATRGVQPSKTSHPAGIVSAVPSSFTADEASATAAIAVRCLRILSTRDYLNVIGPLSGPNGERSRRFLMTGGSFSRT